MDGTDAVRAAVRGDGPACRSPHWWSRSGVLALGVATVLFVVMLRRLERARDLLADHAERYGALPIVDVEGRPQEWDARAPGADAFLDGVHSAVGFVYPFGIGVVLAVALVAAAGLAALARTSGRPRSVAGWGAAGLVALVVTVAVRYGDTIRTALVVLE